MKDISIDGLAGMLREGKLEGEVEFVGNVLVFSGAKATSLFLEHYGTRGNDKLVLISLDNKRYQIFSEDRESSSPDRKKRFKLNFLIKDSNLDFDLRNGSISMNINFPERDDLDVFYLRLDNLRNIRY